MTHPISWLTRAAVWLAGGLPVAALGGLGAAAGWFWYRVVPIRRQVARENIQRALGLSSEAAEPLVREMYLHLGRSAAELLALDRLARGVQVSGEAAFRAALAPGNGILLVTAHLGNWEVLVRVATAAGRPVHVVTKRLHRGWAEAAWRALRRDGASLLHEKGSARAILAALRRGEIVAFVLDQHEASASAWIGSFFGRPAATSSGLARLARVTAAPVLPVFTWRGADGRHHVEFGDALAAGPELEVQGRDAAVADLTRRCLAVVESAIREHPGQWLWIHRRWKVELGGRVNPAEASRAEGAHRRGRGRASAHVARPLGPSGVARGEPQPPRD